MALLKDVQAKIPSADTVAGRVIAYHAGKHYDLGEHVGEGVVRLNKAGEELLASVEVVPPAVQVVAEEAAEDLPPELNADLGEL